MRVFNLDGTEITKPLILMVESLTDAIGLHEMVCADGKPHPGLLIIGDATMDTQKVSQAIREIFNKHGDPNWSLTLPSEGPQMPGGFSMS